MPEEHTLGASARNQRLRACTLPLGSLRIGVFPRSLGQKGLPRETGGFYQ